MINAYLPTIIMKICLLLAHENFELDNYCFKRPIRIQDWNQVAEQIFYLYARFSLATSNQLFSIYEMKEVLGHICVHIG